MKVEDCIVTVERRSIGGCIDLAFVFGRQFARPLLGLTFCFAVPSTLMTWFIGSSMRHDVLLPALLIFAFFNMLLSGAMVATVGPQVFGVPMSVRAALKSLMGRLISYSFLATLARSTGFCVFIPLIFVMSWCGHLPEVMFLERTPLNQLTQRLSWLTKACIGNPQIGSYKLLLNSPGFYTKLQFQIPTFVSNSLVKIAKKPGKPNNRIRHPQSHLNHCQQPRIIKNFGLKCLHLVWPRSNCAKENRSVENPTGKDIHQHKHTER